MRGKVLLLMTILLFTACASTGKNLRKEDGDLYLARKFRQQGDDVRAAVFYLRVLNKRPEFVEALKFMHKFYEDHGDKARAFECLLRLSEAEPENPEWHYQIGLILMADGDIKDGCEELELAVRLSKGEKKIPDKYKEVCGR